MERVYCTGKGELVCQAQTTTGAMYVDLINGARYRRRADLPQELHVQRQSQLRCPLRCRAVESTSPKQYDGCEKNNEGTAAYLLTLLIFWVAEEQPKLPIVLLLLLLLSAKSISISATPSPGKPLRVLTSNVRKGTWAVNAASQNTTTHRREGLGKCGLCAQSVLGSNRIAHLSPLRQRSKPGWARGTTAREFCTVQKSEALLTRHPST